MMSIRGVRFEKRLRTSRVEYVIAVVVALLAALLVAAILMRIAHADIPLAASSLFRGSFGGQRELLETLVQATPLIFTGLAMTVAFQGQVWNIGAEGQFYAGAILATSVGLHLGNLPPISAIAIGIIASSFAGAAWGGIAALVKVRFGVSEIIVTVLMNFIMSYILSYLLSGPLQDPGSFYLQSSVLPASTSFPPLIARNRLHLGLPIALLLAALVYVLLWKTSFGYEVRALGGNPKAALFKGVNPARITVTVLALSGAIAGLAGGSELFGIHHRLRLTLSTGYGFTGIPVALLAGKNPFLVIVFSIFFGALINGSTAMQIATGVPTALVQAIQGIILVFVLAAEWFTRYRVRIG